MSSPRVFILGATGYIGGSAISRIIAKHPALAFSALVRSPSKASSLSSAFANITPIIGDLDSASVIEDAAAQADIVLNFASADHGGAAQAIINGLAKRAKPTVYIHTSGTGILGDIELKRFGQYTDEKIYNDLDGVKEIVEGLPDSKLHRTVDRMVLAATKTGDKIRTAIVCPPLIHGVGYGPGNNRSVQVPMTINMIFKARKIMTINGGHNVWNQVNIRDLANAYNLLFEAGLKELGFSAEGASVSWGPEAYYFVEDGEFKWSEISEGVLKYLQANPDSAAAKYVKDASKLTAISSEEAEQLVEGSTPMCGMNSRCRALRARKYLGWKPEYPKVAETLVEEVEYQVLQMK